MKKKFIIFLIIIVLIFLAVFSYFMFFRDSSRSISDQDRMNDQALQTGSATTSEAIKKIRANLNDGADNSGSQNTVKQDKSVKKDDLKRMAGLFAERFGSYSNQSNFSNINDLKIFMSRNMSVWADNYVAQQKKSAVTDIYYGITTKSVSQEVKDFDDDGGKASIMVNTRRREANGTTNNISNIFNQSVLIDFIKENGIWKVDSASWQI